jgi:hypothetical protein
MLTAESHDWTPAQRARIAAAIVVGLIAVSALVFGYQHFHRTKPLEGIEKTEDLGSGFRRITVAKLNKGELGHYAFFFYGDRRLSPIASPPSISPSGRFAVYQEFPSGKLMLFRRDDGKVIQLTATGIGVPSRYVWQEDQGTVEAVLGKEGISSIFSLH